MMPDEWKTGSSVLEGMSLSDDPERGSHIRVSSPEDSGNDFVEEQDNELADFVFAVSSKNH